MQIRLASIFVDDQERALRFYTEKAGFVKKHDIPLGGDHRWLTVAAPDGPDGMELLLEPNAHTAAKVFQEAIRAEGLPATTLFSDDVRAEYERMQALGVEFTMPPTAAGDSVMAVFDDTCGNLVMVHQG